MQPLTLNILGQLLPLTPGAEILRDLMARNESLNFPKLAIAFINELVYQQKIELYEIRLNRYR